jgi:hypothetical protein
VVLGHTTRGLRPPFPGLKVFRDAAEVVQVSLLRIGCDLVAPGTGVAGDRGVGLVDGEVLGPGLGGSDRSTLCLLLAVVPRVEVGQLLAELTWVCSSDLAPLGGVVLV